MNYLIIGVGGFIGAIARYVLAVWIGERWGRSFPLGTLIINVSGSFLIGVMRSDGISERAVFVVSKQGKIAWVKLYDIPEQPDLEALLAALTFR